MLPNKKRQEQKPRQKLITVQLYAKLIFNKTNNQRTGHKAR